MSVNFKALVKYQKGLEKVAEELPRIMGELVVGEGVVAVKHARNLCEARKVDNTSRYKRSFHTGDSALGYEGAAMQDGSRPKVSGTVYRTDFYNNVDYASDLEYGFRSHFVPGHWEGDTFVYQPKDPAGGMWVGPRHTKNAKGEKVEGRVPGKFVFRDAMKNTALTRGPRLQRKFERKIAEALKKQQSGGGE